MSQPPEDVYDNEKILQAIISIKQGIILPDIAEHLDILVHDMNVSAIM